jgi:hypothetical protein
MHEVIGHSRQVGVAQFCQQSCLTKELAGGAGRLGTVDFDGEVMIEGDIVRLIHGTHAAFTKLLDNLIPFFKNFPGFQFHERYYIRQAVRGIEKSCRYRKIGCSLDSLRST